MIKVLYDNYSLDCYILNGKIKAIFTDVLYFYIFGNSKQKIIYKTYLFLGQIKTSYNLYVNSTCVP